MLPFWETNMFSKQSRTIPQTWAVNPWCKRWGINGILRIENFPFLFFVSITRFGQVKASHHSSKSIHEKRVYANVLQRNQVKNFEHWTSYWRVEYTELKKKLRLWGWNPLFQNPPLPLVPKCFNPPWPEIFLTSLQLKTKNIKMWI